MDFFQVVQTRRSIRAFTSQPIEPEKQRALVETANRAPSAGNLQAYEVFDISNRAVLHKLVRAAMDQEFIEQAPWALVFCANPSRSEKRYMKRGMSLYSIQDATIACAYAQLAATALGLSSVWVGAFDDNKVRQVIGVGKDIQPVAILPIGYADEDPGVNTRRSLSDLVHTIA